MGWQRAKALFTISLLVQVFVLAGTTFATTHYVSKLGTSTPPYLTWETAAWFIESASEVSALGDTVLVESGDYQIHATITLSPGIVLMGKGMDSTRLIGRSTVPYIIIPSESIVIDGFEFIGDDLTQYGSDYQGSRIGIFITYPSERISFTVNSCRFIKFKYAGIVTIDDVDNCFIHNCQFDLNPSSSLDLGYLGNYYVENCEFSTSRFGCSGFIDFTSSMGKKVVRNNRFNGSPASGAISCELFTWGYLEVENNIFYGTSGYSPVVSSLVAQLIIRNNTVLFTDNTIYSDEVFLVRASSLDSAIIENNIIVGTNWQISIGHGTPQKLRIANNCLYSRMPRTPGQVIVSTLDNAEVLEIEDNTYFEPMFVDAANGNFDLQRGSPCIDSGNPLILDVDGSQSDIGATGGPRGHSYAYQNFAPLKPRQFTGNASSTVVSLRWLANIESDLSRYELFRSNDSIVPADVEHLIGTIMINDENCFNGSDADSEFVAFFDSLSSRDQNYYYAVRAVDQFSESSELSDIYAVILTDTDDYPDAALPEGISLEQNYPNPFNATTAIVYSLPNIGAQPASVKLVIFNSIGQQVRVLVDQAQAPGRQAAYWDGNDDGGESVASGVYFYSLKVSGVELVKKRKMVVVK